MESTPETSVESKSMAWRKAKRARTGEGSRDRGNRILRNRRANAEGLGMLPEQSKNAIVLRARKSRLRGEGLSGVTHPWSNNRGELTMSPQLDVMVCASSQAGPVTAKSASPHTLTQMR